MENKGNKMINKVFGEMYFDTSWKTKSEITLWGKVYKIKIDVETYRKENEITNEQQESYINFLKIKNVKQNTIERLLSEYFEDQEDDLDKILTPTTLVIEKNGDLVLLFDDENDQDNGIAVKLYPEEEVMTQDEYL